MHEISFLEYKLVKETIKIFYSIHSRPAMISRYTGQSIDRKLSFGKGLVVENDNRHIFVLTY